MLICSCSNVFCCWLQILIQQQSCLLLAFFNLIWSLSSLFTIYLTGFVKPLHILGHKRLNDHRLPENISQVRLLHVNGRHELMKLNGWSVSWRPTAGCKSFSIDTYRFSASRSLANRVCVQADGKTTLILQVQSDCEGMSTFIGPNSFKY